MFLKKEISQGRNNSALGSRGFKHYIFDQQFYTNMPESLENMLTYDMPTYDIIILPEVDQFIRNCEFCSDYISSRTRTKLK